MKLTARKDLKAYQHLIVYGISMFALLFLLKWLHWKFLIVGHSTDIYIGLVALLFTLLGIWIAKQIVKPKIETRVVEKLETVVVEKIVYLEAETNTELNKEEINNLNLSSREQEVLALVVQGMSNAEIADKLFLSLSTIKTHVSNLFVKMDVKRRTQLIEKSRRLKITH